MKLLLNFRAGCIWQARHKPSHEKGQVATPAPLERAWEYQ